MNTYALICDLLFLCLLLVGVYLGYRAYCEPPQPVEPPMLPTYTYTPSKLKLYRVSSLPHRRTKNRRRHLQKYVVRYQHTHP